MATQAHMPRPWAKYVVHCLRQPYDVLISRNTVYGNPFTHLDLRRTQAKIQVPTRSASILSHMLWLSEDWANLRLLVANDAELERAKLLVRPTTAQIHAL